MNITANHNLPIFTGFERPTHPRGSSADAQPKQTANHSLANQIVQSQLNIAGTVSSSQRVRPTINAQPVFDQNLTHRGAQAKDVYQDVELSNEAELMPRLNVVA